MIGRLSAASIAATTVLLTVPATTASAAVTVDKAATASAAGAATSWQHAVLIYHSPGRDRQQWEQHLMAVNAAGQFTGKWLFDAAIVTTQTIDGTDIMDTSLTETDLTDLLNQEFADAAALDSAAAALAQQYGAQPSRSRSRWPCPGWTRRTPASLCLVERSTSVAHRTGWTRPTGTCSRSSRRPRPRTGPS
jgi:hypothetical protein